MSEIFHQFNSNTIPARSRMVFDAFPRRSGILTFVRIRYSSGVPTYAYVDSFKVVTQEFVWPYPEKQFPIELFADKGALAMEPKLREIFPTPIVRIGTGVAVGIHNYAPEPIAVSVTFEWEEL